MFSQRILLLVAAISVVGCASRPSLTYSKIDTSTKPLLHFTDSYFLNVSKVAITPNKGKDDAGNMVTQYAISSEPIEYQNFKVGVVSRNNFISTTKLNITKAENSDRYASGGTETTDNVKTLISTVGGIIVKGLTMAGPAPVSAPVQEVPVPDSCATMLTKPFVIEFSSIKDAENNPNFPVRFVPTDSTTSCVHLTLDPLPPDAKKIDEFPWNTPTSDYFYSACRNLTVTVTYADQHLISKVVRIADPNYYQSVQYPYKGSVTMHSQCGVSVKTDALANPLAGLDSVAELLKQIDAVNTPKK